MKNTLFSIKLACSVITIITVLCFNISTIYCQETKRIKILNADYIEKDDELFDGAQRLIGEVEFEHDGAFMYCDSAHFYPEKRLVYAFENVHIERGDTIDLYGDSAIYRGLEKMAEFRKNVELIDRETVLTTEYLDFDLEKNIGYYKDGGTIVNDADTLLSLEGRYYSNDKEFFFKDSVEIHNEKYVIYSDTLKYNTETKQADLFGPTEIISEENFIYCENGWYNTESDICQFNKNAYLTNENSKISGDSLYYDRNNGHGRAFNNVEIIDTSRQVILKGNFANYFENPERSLLTDSALAIQYDAGDSLYIHGDTLRTFLDTVDEKVITGYFKVKVFRSNMQGMCDSLSYTLRDSTIHLYTDPVIWSENSQITADLILMHTKETELDYAEMFDNSMIIQEDDTSRYNQIKGKNMTGYFSNNALTRMDVNGNGELIYYPKDEGGIIGINKSVSSDMVILFSEGKVERIKFLTQPESSLIPMNDPEARDNKLKGFQWLDEHRPKKMTDIYIWK